MFVPLKFPVWSFFPSSKPDLKPEIVRSVQSTQCFKFCSYSGSRVVMSFNPICGVRKNAVERNTFNERRDFFSLSAAKKKREQ